MKCPKCEALLKPANVRDTEVDRCVGCGGIWFDAKELSALLGLTATDLRPLARAREDELLNLKRGRCPRDGKDLLRVYSAANPAVIVDTCTTCEGIWLDGGELAKLLP